MNRIRLDTFARRWWAGELGAFGVLLHSLMLPVEWMYRAAVGLRNRSYERGLLGVHRAEIPVISIGNVAVGGTGKTPFAHWLAVRLRDRGHTPAVLHGGYASDEPELHRRWAPEIPVIVDRDRRAGARQAQRSGATVLVLDDAFQHRRLHRDVDIVLVSVERWMERSHLLPRGPWREPRSALRRADLVVCTRKVASPADAAAVAAEAAALSERPVALVHLQAAGWRTGSGREGLPAGPTLLVAALAEPGFFLADARAAGADVANVLTFPDHHGYTATDAMRIRECAAGRVVVTTEKDWTKLDGLLEADRTWLLIQSVTVEGGADLIDAALAGVVS